MKMSRTVGEEYSPGKRSVRWFLGLDGLEMILRWFVGNLWGGEWGKEEGG